MSGGKKPPPKSSSKTDQAQAIDTITLPALALLQVGDGLGGFVQRIGAVNHRDEFAGCQQFLDE